MSEYFSANVNIGKKGNSIQRVSLYACSSESTCEITPLPGYDNILWTDAKFSPIYENGSYPSLSGLTTFITNLILYTHTHIKVSVTSGYTGNCLITRIIPIIGIPTPTPTPTVTPTPTPVPTDTPTPTPTVTPPPCSFDGTVVYGLPQTPTPTPTVTATPTATPTVTPTATLSPGQCYRYRIDENSPINGQLTQYGIRYTYPGSISTDNALNSFMSGLITVDGNIYYTYSVCSSVEPTWLEMITSNSGTGAVVPSGVYRDGPLGGCSGNADCQSLGS